MQEISSDQSGRFKSLLARPRSRPLSQQDQIVRAIGLDIISGLIPPGERIPAEAQLLARFDVSRSVLREALKTLTAKGLLIVRAHIGAKVRDSAHWSVLDPDLLAWRLDVGPDPTFRDHLQELRLSLAPTAAGLAAKRRTERDVAAMSFALAALNRSGDSGQAQAAAHLKFQATVTGASGNPVIQSVCDLIEAALAEAVLDRRTADLRRSVAAALVERIVERDEAGAGACAIKFALD